MAKKIYDEIGYWSEIKLDIIKNYACEYTKILSKQRMQFAYIDAFAGSGVHLAKSSGEFIPGSPLNALLVKPPFKEYHFIDLDQNKANNLRKISEAHSNVHIYDGDCNVVLLKDIYPKMRHEDYRRALCILDPYGLHLNWGIIETAGKMKSIELFINFPVYDMNLNVLLWDTTKIKDSQAGRMNAFWGDDSWRQAAYNTQGNLFGFEEKQSNEIIAKAFQARLMDKAGFAYVPDPIPMRNAQNAIVYYLFFASQKPVAAKIVKYIFDKYKQKH